MRYAKVCASALCFGLYEPGHSHLTALSLFSGIKEVIAAMSIKKLCVAFQRIAVSRINVTARCYSTQQSKWNTNVTPRQKSNCHMLHYTEPTHSIKFTPGTLNIDFGVPRNTDLIKNIIDMPVAKIPSLQDPVTWVPIQYDFPVAEKTIDLPAIKEIFEKQAVRLIVIRRKKIKKHKRKKLRKKMAYEWAKVRQKRTQKRERAFHAELISQIKTAEAFDPKEYVQERLNILNKERIPRTYRGEILPQEMIKKFIEEKKKIREEKRNIPRLTL